MNHDVIAPDSGLRIQHVSGHLEATLPLKKNWFLIVFVMVWLIVWFYFGSMKLFSGVTGVDGSTFSKLWLIIWIVIGVRFLQLWGWNIFGAEHIIMTPAETTIFHRCLGFSKLKQIIRTSEIKDFSVVTPGSSLTPSNVWTGRQLLNRGLSWKEKLSCLQSQFFMLSGTNSIAERQNEFWGSRGSGSIEINTSLQTIRFGIRLSQDAALKLASAFNQFLQTLH